MRRLLILAALLLGSATAQTPEIGPSGASEPSVTLTCQAAAPRVAVLCSVERTVAEFGGFAVTLGVEARAAFYQPVDGHVAGYVTVSYSTLDGRGYYWLDVRTPEIAPILGTSDVVRVGLSTQIRWP